jgi:hypothetical protein
MNKYRRFFLSCSIVWFILGIVLVLSLCQGCYRPLPDDPPKHPIIEQVNELVGLLGQEVIIQEGDTLIMVEFHKDDIITCLNGKIRCRKVLTVGEIK